jgi:hypothetical protein
MRFLHKPPRGGLGRSESQIKSGKPEDYLGDRTLEAFRLYVASAFRLLLEPSRFHQRLIVKRANLGAVLLAFNAASVGCRHNE